MKILFLPFLQMRTGHHTVADAMIRSLENRMSNITCKKIDFFSYADKLLEKAFRLTYLTWIDHSPQTFARIYRNFVYPSKATKHFNWYEVKFLDKMNALLNQEQPDLIVCTQAFPSFLISRLRYSGISTPPVINVYTDFFVNKLWGIHDIDFHFVPDQNIKAQLIANHDVNPSKIFVTGIPVDECFVSRPPYHPTSPSHILISGGSGGLGDIQSLISSLPEDDSYYFSLLCGSNKKLYKEALSAKFPNLRPLSYISSRDTMNSLYDQAHAIITKPGGVTLSEALYKRLPIFIHSSLPGQEIINKEYLLQKRLIYDLDLGLPLVDQLDCFFKDTNEQRLWNHRLDDYLTEIECPAWQKIMELAIQASLKPKEYRKKAAISQGTS